MSDVVRGFLKEKKKGTRKAEMAAVQQAKLVLTTGEACPDNRLSLS